MEKKKNSNGLSFIRRLLSLILVIGAVACLTYGTLVSIAGQALSKKVIRTTINKVDLQEEYGEEVAHLINVAIKHLTNSGYTENLYLTVEDLEKYVDEAAVKDFLTNKFAEFGATFGDGSVAELSSEEILPLFSGIREHIQEETGVTISDEKLLSEIANIMGGSDLHSITEKVFNPSHATWFIVLGIVLLLGAFLISWPKILWGSMLIIISLCVSCLLVLAFSGVVSMVLDVAYITEQIGGALAIAWIETIRNLIVTRALRLLLGLILPGALVTAYWLDWKRIRHWKRMGGDYE